MIPNARFASRYNRASNNAPQGSNRGIVTVFNGATRNLVHINFVIVFPHFPLEYIRYPTQLASQNP